MAFHKILAAIGILLFLTNPCFSSDDEYVSKEHYQQIIFNHSILNIARDSSVFLHSLKTLRPENAGEEVANFMEYQLDEIVCAIEKFDNKMNPSQKKLTQNVLSEIKKYRAEYPRNKPIEIDPTKFSKYFGPFDKTYAERAEKILAAVE